jgi:hypothetical protein
MGGSSPFTAISPTAILRENCYFSSWVLVFPPPERLRHTYTLSRPLLNTNLPFHILQIPKDTTTPLYFMYIKIYPLPFYSIEQPLYRGKQLVLASNSFKFYPYLCVQRTIV